ncbi:MAG: protein kinase, partial [Planctomycetia bacterium]|nr:protein kinase [Planctomycetia bacterium]
MSTPFPPPPPQIGPFRIVRVLGRGGMGVVYEGVEPGSGQRAAIKTILSHYASESSVRKRFEAEIDALVRLNHPNIVRILGSGVTGTGDLFYAMEMVWGMDLEHAVPRGTSISWVHAVGILIEICRGLKAAHDRGIVHR